MVINSVLNSEIDETVFNNILSILKDTGQLSTTVYVHVNAVKWYIMKDGNDSIIGFAALKQPRKSGFDYEIGYGYMKEQYRHKNKFTQIYNRILAENKGKKLYFTTFNKNIEKLIGSYEFKQIDSWASDSNPENTVKLFSNATNENVFTNLLHKNLFNS